MLKLYPEQLRAQLNEGLRAAYLLLGNDPLLLQESEDAIRQAAATQGFEEHHAFTWTIAPTGERFFHSARR